MNSVAGSGAKNGMSPLRVFGERVRARRRELGLTQKDLAATSGLHRAYIGSVDRGQRNLSLVNILRIAEALAVDPAVLVQGLKPTPE
jgi:transcriptional regulator with XRE-family HTH domain